MSDKCGCTSTCVDKNIVGVNVQDGYERLMFVLTQALNQAQFGKGKVRHAVGGQPFHEQQICEIARRLGVGYTLGQAVKKIYESQRLDTDAAIAELHGAINYIAATCIILEEQRKDEVIYLSVPNELPVEFGVGKAWTLVDEAEDVSFVGRCAESSETNR